ncbi:hypothetical protein C2W64_01988 [Brevibacillus laterosporus]|nr:hypothetical protein C2W64_01988 [Brevibacillus laterosporus]
MQQILSFFRKIGETIEIIGQTFYIIYFFSYVYLLHQDVAETY